MCVWGWGDVGVCVVCGVCGVGVGGVCVFGEGVV